MLRRRGRDVVDPESGRLAGGDVGAGRLAAPETIVAAVERRRSARQDLDGARASLVTAGGTREPIDPVRFIGNRSSGKQGHAIAEEAAARGAPRSCSSHHDRSPVRPPASSGCRSRPPPQMDAPCTAAPPAPTSIVMAAAVADFRPVAAADHKIKKGDGVPEVVPRADPRHPRRPRSRQDRRPDARRVRGRDLRPAAPTRPRS